MIDWRQYLYVFMLAIVAGAGWQIGREAMSWMAMFILRLVTKR